MLWIKAFHIIFVVTWFAGLFYLPRLFVYHSQATDATSIARFKIMERRLFQAIMTPSAVIAVGLGLTLYLHFGVGRGMGWMHAKLVLVAILIAHHIYLGKLLNDFARDQSCHSHRFYRWLNEIPAAPVLFGAVILAVVKPSF